MKIIKYIYILFFIQFPLFFSIPITNAQLLEDPTPLYNQTEKFREKTGIGDPVQGNEIGNIAETIIKAFLSLLAVIFIILIIVAGFNWMTAAGDESKVTFAKDTIKRAIIGIIITVSAYAITAFVFRNLPMGDGSTNSGDEWSWN